MDELLLTLAEIAATFAGMVGIMVAFTTSSGKLSPADSLRVRAIIPLSIFSAFYAALPLLLGNLSLLEPVVWQLSAITHSMFILGMSAYLFRYEAAAGTLGVSKMQGVHREMAWVLAFAALAINIVNVSPLLGPAQGGLYAISVTIVMLCSGVLFIGLIYQRLL
jgi:hypothetical protein